jgi:hypothetical protein
LLSASARLVLMDPPVDWVEGVAIIVAVLIVVGVGSLNDWQKVSPRFSADIGAMTSVIYFTLAL